MSYHDTDPGSNPVAIFFIYFSFNKIIELYNYHAVTGYFDISIFRIGINLKFLIVNYY